MATENSPLIGPLQVRVMNVLWELGPSTVHTVHDRLNDEPNKPKLAYTTILTVMRNLARRKVCEQKAAGRSHIFVPLVARDVLRRQVANYVADLYFGGDPAALKAALATPDLGCMPREDGACVATAPCMHSL